MIHKFHLGSNNHSPHHKFALADMWYVNADGKEGWLPSNILRAMLGDDLTMTSGESTPAEVKLNSTGVSADASDMSDSDGKL